MNEITRILSAIEQGNARAASQLLPLVYEELRWLAAQKLACKKPGQTLDAMALVHEAYLRLGGQNAEQHWDSRGHFFAAAADISADRLPQLGLGPGLALPALQPGRVLFRRKAATDGTGMKPRAAVGRNKTALVNSLLLGIG
jgi:hypothetical protein